MSKDYPLVALVVPVHNNKEDTVEFLESLKGVIYPNYKVIIIDDGSTDGTEEMIKEKYPYVTLLKGNGSLWWAGATNRGIKKAIEMDADYVLLGGMNDTIVNSEFISALVDTAEKNPRSITTSKAYHYYDPKRIWHIGGEINWLKGGLISTGSNEIDDGQYNIQRDVKWATIAVLVNTAFFDDIGIMDSKNFPQYWGDADFAIRAYKKGYRIIYEPKSMLWHKVSSTVKKETPTANSFLSTFIYLMTSIRSQYNFNMVTKFYSRHCPIYLVPYVLVRYYTRVILFNFLAKYIFNRCPRIYLMLHFVLHYMYFAKAMEARIISRFLELKKGEKVCDIACGAGLQGIKMAKRGCEVYGIDLNAGAIETAKSIAKCYDCDFQVGNAEKIPYDSNMFDKVVSVCALEHFANDEKAIEEMNRVLKPDGILVLTVDSFTYKGIKKPFQEKHRTDCSVVNYYSVSQLTQKLEKYGFKVLKSKYFINSPISSFFFTIGLRFGVGYIFRAIFPIAYSLSLLSDYFFGHRKEGYLLAIKAQKVE